MWNHYIAVTNVVCADGDHWINGQPLFEEEAAAAHDLDGLLQVQNVHGLVDQLLRSGEKMVIFL